MYLLLFIYYYLNFYFKHEHLCNENFNLFLKSHLHETFIKGFDCIVYAFKRGKFVPGVF
jgi:hypothetical protein